MLSLLAQHYSEFDTRLGENPRQKGRAQLHFFYDLHSFTSWSSLVSHAWQFHE